MNENILGSRIKELREENKINQLDLAKYLNIGNTTLSQYESGKRIPSDEIKKKLAEYFNVSMDYIMGLTDIREPANVLKSNKKTTENKLKEAAELVYKSANSKEQLTPAIFSAMLIKKLIEENIIGANGEIDDETLNFIKQAIKMDAQLTNNYKKDAED